MVSIDRRILWFLAIVVVAVVLWLLLDHVLFPTLRCRPPPPPSSNEARSVVRRDQPRRSGPVGTTAFR